MHKGLRLHCVYLDFQKCLYVRLFFVTFLQSRIMEIAPSFVHKGFTIFTTVRAACGTHTVATISSVTDSDPRLELSFCL